MKYWDFVDWIFFGMLVAAIVIGVVVFLPVLIFTAKESWSLLFSTM